MINKISKYKLTNFENIITLNKISTSDIIELDILQSSSYFIKTSKNLNINLNPNYKELELSDNDFLKLDIFIYSEATNNLIINFSISSIQIFPNHILYVILFSNNSGKNWYLLFNKDFTKDEIDLTSFKYTEI